jgi:hypothetical protein
MSGEKMLQEKKVVAETKLTEEAKLYEEKKSVDPYVVGFVESMAKTNTEKITKEILEGLCWGLVLKCYESRTRQHKVLKVNILRPSKHYLP